VDQPAGEIVFRAFSDWIELESTLIYRTSNPEKSATFRDYALNSMELQPSAFVYMAFSKRSPD
jgi:hypothetical protein